MKASGLGMVAQASACECRWMTLTWLLAMAIGPAAAQTSKPYIPPRMADGHPDLQGTYDLATLTPLERAPGTKLVLTKGGI